MCLEANQALRKLTESIAILHTQVSASTWSSKAHPSAAATSCPPHGPTAAVVDRVSSHDIDLLLSTVLKFFTDLKLRHKTSSTTLVSTPVVRVEELGQHICNIFGHKMYKKVMSSSRFKTLKKFLAAHPSHFTLHYPDSREVAVSCCEEGSGGSDGVDCAVQAEDNNNTTIVTDGRKDCLYEDIDDEVVAVAVAAATIGTTAIVAAPALRTTEEELQDILKLYRHCSLDHLPTVEYTAGDIFAVDWWSEANVVYAASLLFTVEMMEELSRKVSLMRSGAYVITLKPLIDLEKTEQHQLDGADSIAVKTRFELLSDSFYKMSWQMAKVYIYRIIN